VNTGNNPSRLGLDNETLDSCLRVKTSQVLVTNKQCQFSQWNYIFL